MEKNPGFRLTAPMLLDAGKALTYGDLFMRCVYRVRPYELVPGSTNRLHDRWEKIAIESLTDKQTQWTYREVCEGIVQAFDSLPIDESLRKPRVGIVGEILVKYMPLANNHLVDLLEREGAEAVLEKYAKDNGIELTDEEKQQVDDSIAEIKESASNYGYANGDKFIAANYGVGNNLKTAKAYATEYALASKVYTQVAEETSAAVTPEEIKEQYPSVAVRHILVKAEAAFQHSVRRLRCPIYRNYQGRSRHGHFCG